MKISTAVAVALLLSPLALCAQTNVTPPDTKAPAPMEAMKPPVPPSKSVNLSFEGKTATL